jgi:hypothetical protein
MSTMGAGPSPLIQARSKPVTLPSLFIPGAASAAPFPPPSVPGLLSCSALQLPQLHNSNRLAGTTFAMVGAFNAS